MTSEIDPGRLKDLSKQELVPAGWDEPLEIKNTIWFDAERDFSDSSLWRYLKLWQLESIIESGPEGRGKLYFSKVKNLQDEDPSEGRMPDRLIEKQRGELASTLTELDTGKPIEFANRAVEDDRKFWETMRKSSFVNCWNLSQIESNVMWKAYTSMSISDIEHGRDHRGVAIKTTYDDFIESLEEWKHRLIVGPVKYVSDDTEAPYPPSIEPLFRKRTGFRAERELRAVITTYDGPLFKPGEWSTPEQPSTRALRPTVHLDKLIAEVKISPHVPEYDDVVHKVERILSKGNISADIKQSDLAEK